MPASPLRRNAFANLVGQLWTLALQLLMVPVYLRWLGLEAYGLLGIQVTLLWAAAVLDVGLSGTVNRELSRASVQPVAPTQLRDMVRSLECIVWPVALLIALAGWAASGFLAGTWLRPVRMTAAETALAVTLMTAAIAAQWPAGFYGGALAGMNRQVLLNALHIGFGTLKAVGVLLPLWLVEPTATVYFSWQLAIAALHTAVVAAVAWRCLPRSAARARCRGSELARVGSFTGAVGLIGLLGFVLMQTDRIVLSTLLPLDQFGHYALAIAIGTAVHRLIVPMQTALFPRFSQLLAGGAEHDLRRLYHNSSQVVAVLTIPMVIVLAVFAEDVIHVWTGNLEVARASGATMAVLAVGYGLNGLMIVPYTLQLAHAVTTPTMTLLAALAALSLPATWVAAQAHGGLGAAAVWTVVNVVYVAIGVPWTHARLLKGASLEWLSRDVAPVLVIASALTLLARAAFGELPTGLAGVAALAAIGGTVLLASAVAVRHPRALLLHWLSGRSAA